jgi:hypothetical protein
MTRTLFALTAWLTLGGTPLARAAEAAAGDAPASPDSRYVIPSWGDMTLVYGPGTDPAMDTPGAMERMFEHWKGRGFTGVYLRTDLAQCPPGAIVRHEGRTQPNPELAVAWRLIDDVMERADPHHAARAAEERTGFEYWMWHPYLYSEGAPADVGVDGTGRMVPWSYVRRYHAEHPEVITVDRKGNRQWMVPEYAYAGARADKVAEFVHMARTYRPTGILASLRSEASQVLPPPDHGDQYGFNEPVVTEMKRRYDVDILTDPRFDWQSPGFDGADPMVENWRRLRGSYLTQLVRDIRAGLREVDPNIQFAMTLSGDHVGPVLGNWTMDWRTWVDEGLVDAIVMPVFFEATPDPDSAKKGYLTNLLAGVGGVGAAEVKAYVKQSKHPGVRVIHTGAPSYFYPPAPAGSDGWQCDAWYDAYHLAWHQRWSQWVRDVREFGHVRFIEQNFDAFPVRASYAGGGSGDMRYDPGLRACPGVWRRLGDGAGGGDAVVQPETRRGDSGNAVLLTSQDLIARHASSPDRANVTAMLDPAIASGTATFEFWLYRPDEHGALAAHLTGDVRYEMDVGLRVEAGTGRLSYASGAEWVATEARLEPKRWHRLMIEVDVDRLTYAAFLGVDRAPVCAGVKFAPAPERVVAQPTVNVPTRMPSYRVFNVLYFIPAKDAGNRVYLDDVLVRWTPALHYAPPGAAVAARETFEPHAAGPVQSVTPDAPWRIEPASDAKRFSIENTTSFGAGVKCLRAAGGGSVTGDIAGDSASKRITVDLDVFVRSGRDFPYILPDPATRSAHDTVIGIQAAGAESPLAAVKAEGGTWKLWDGARFADSGKPVAYDVWNHVQLAVDVEAGRYALVVQPVGELPTPVGSARWVVPPDAGGERLTWKIAPSDTKGHTSCYDNIVVTVD